MVELLQASNVLQNRRIVENSEQKIEAVVSIMVDNLNGKMILTISSESMGINSMDWQAKLLTL